MLLEKQTKNPLVDEWAPDPSDVIFTNSKNIISAKLDKYFHVNNENSNFLNCFMVNTKKSYNSDDIRNHYCHYLNYFEKFYDTELEYFTNLANMKFCIDCYKEYREPNFIFDINKYILNESILNKVKKMVDDNYSLQLSYKLINNPQLQYTNDHAKVMMHISILVNMCIPLITHFAYMKRIQDIDEFLLDVYDNIFYHPYFSEVDIPSKLYQTTIYNVDKNAKNNAPIWMPSKQDIRGKDTITHSEAGVRNIILNIIPKYVFSHSMVNLNYTSIQKNNKYQITDIAYEFTYIPLSSAAGEGEDSSSDLDKYEANLNKSDQSIFLQAQINCQIVMEQIEKLWGPFSKDEIDFYYNELKNESGNIMNGFQMQLIFNLFYKFFGDTESIKGINQTDYIKLMLSAKKMLKNNMMTFFPYIISAKVEKIAARKTLNKKELQKMENSQYYPLVVEKYKNNPKILKQILSVIATIITSDFKFIDFDRNNLESSIGCNGNYITNAGEINSRRIEIISDILIEEALLYILLI